EAEVEVAAVVVDGPAAGEPADDVDAALLHVARVDLLDRVLAAPDDDRGLVDVEEDVGVARVEVAQRVLLDREVDVRIGDALVVYVDEVSHGRRGLWGGVAEGVYHRRGFHDSAEAASRRLWCAPGSLASSKACGEAVENEAEVRIERMERVGREYLRTSLNR